MDNGKEATFPVVDNTTAFYVPGLTKREYFAAMAMQGFVSNGTYFQGYSSNADMARIAVDMADKLLAELSTPQP